MSTTTIAPVGNFTRVVRIGLVPCGHRRESFFAKVTYTDGKLSITGVVGPNSAGNARGSAGQVIMSFKAYDARGHLKRSDIEPAPGWDRAMIKKFLDAWAAWHLNDMRPGCEHQMADGWDKKPIDPSKPTTAYGRHFDGQRQDSWNLLGWVSATEHPEGLMGKPCPTCGAKYGHAWYKAEVPADVLAFLMSLPAADRQPAWV